MDGEGKGRIDSLNDMLYSRTRYKDPQDKRTPIKEEASHEHQEKWQTPDFDQMLDRERIEPKAHPMMKKIFALSLVFFVVAIGVAAFVFFGGANFISSKNVDINVLGPATVSAGKVLELGVSVSNTNNADLEFANLSVQYPSGSRNPKNSSEALTFTKDNLGVIKAGHEAVHNVNVVLLGSSDEVKEIKFSVEYKVKGSNATFYKDKIFTVTIGNAPVTLVVDSPTSVTSGDAFTAEVSVTLNTTDVLKNVVLKAEYPYGYSVLNSSSEPALDNNIWVLGDMSPGDKKTININGRILGENREERTLRFYVGAAEGDNSNPNLKVVLASALHTIQIERPAIDLDIMFDGQDVPIYMASAGRPISVTINYRNNLPDKLFNPRLEVGLTGLALDKSQIMPGSGGVYDSASSKIYWNLYNNGGRPELSPGEGGQTTFRFAFLPDISLIKNSQDISLNFVIYGSSNVSAGQKVLTVSENRIARSSSMISLSSKVLRSLGVFANFGPIPPKVGKATTYTVVFNIVNTQNDFTDAKVTARLGSEVTWVGVGGIADENISYDSAANLVTWDIGPIRSGTDSQTVSREVSFQVSLVPTVSQVGTIPNLVNSIVFGARDISTGDNVSINNVPLTTKFTNDPAFIQGDDVVIK